MAAKSVQSGSAPGGAGKGRTDNKRESAAKSIPSAEVSAYLSQIGRKGGRAAVTKGFGSRTPEERKANAQKAAEARWGKKKAGKKKVAGKKK